MYNFNLSEYSGRYKILNHHGKNSIFINFNNYIINIVWLNLVEVYDFSFIVHFVFNSNNYISKNF